MSGHASRPIPQRMGRLNLREERYECQNISQNVPRTTGGVMFGKRFCVRWLLSFLVVEIAASCTAVNTDLAPIDGVPYASITDPATGKNFPDVAYAPVRNGVPYYLPRSLINLAVSVDSTTHDASITATPFEIADLSPRYIAYYAANPFSE